MTQTLLPALLLVSLATLCPGEGVATTHVFDIPELRLVSAQGGVRATIDERGLTDSAGLPLVAIDLPLTPGDGAAGLWIEGEVAARLELEGNLMLPAVVAVGDGAPSGRPASGALTIAAGRRGEWGRPAIVSRRVVHGVDGARLALVIRPLAVTRWSESGHPRELQTYRSIRIQLTAAGSRGTAPRSTGRSTADALAPPIVAPSVIGSSLEPNVVDYVVVTTEAMESSFARLASWRTQTGVPAVVRTVEWIDRSYEGIDGAARVRAFLIEAHRAWGTRYVLIGGDTDHVPVRYLASRYFVLDPVNDVWEIPSDLYYAGLDGDWNADGDALFGEDGDDVDLRPELRVGRAPVTTAAEAAAFVGRQIAHELGRGVRDGFPDSMVLLAEVLFRREDGTPALGLDGAEFAEDVVEFVPESIELTRVYEVDSVIDHDIDLSPATGLHALDAGAGFVVHVGHGFRNTLSLGTGAISNLDVDELSNAPARPVLMALNCSSASFDFNSIGERFIIQPRGGGIAYVGMSRFAFPSTATLYQAWFVREAFEGAAHTVGDALFLTRQRFWNVDQGDLTAHRYTQYTMNLLGDPLTPIQRSRPVPLLVRHEPSTALGVGELVVEVMAGGGPLENAMVTAVGPSGHHSSVMTDVDGRVRLNVSEPEPGLLSITATAPGYLPAVSSACTESIAEPFIAVSELGVVSGHAGVGETVELDVDLRNIGGAPSPAGTVRLALVSGPAFLVGFESALPALDLGARRSVAGFVLDIATEAVDGDVAVLDVTIDAGGGTTTVRRRLRIGAAHLTPAGRRIDDSGRDGVIDPGEEIRYHLVLENVGAAVARGVEAIAQVVELASGEPSSAAVVDYGRVRFGHITPGERTEAEPIVFSLAADVDITSLGIELTYNRPIEIGPNEPSVTTQIVDFIQPEPVTGLVARGTTASVRLSWVPSEAIDLLGYQIERSSTENGTYGVIAAGMRVATFEDHGLDALTEYYYRVRAVDRSRNPSRASAVVVGVTSPDVVPGWPQSLGQETAGSPLLVDLDGDGADEIIAGGDALYVWRGTGAEWRDGDRVATTSGVFSRDGVIDGKKGVHAAPAAADLDGNGSIDLVAVAWEAAELHAWTTDGVPLDGFPRDLIGAPNWGSPVIADLDGDQDLEVVVLSGNQGRLFAWHHDGTEVIDGDADAETDGVFAVGGLSFSFGTPAAADIDGEPGAELIVGFDSPDGLTHVLGHDGRNIAGWPVVTGRTSASPTVVDLDGDGGRDIIIAVESDSVHVFDRDGVRRPGWPQPARIDNASSRSGSPIVLDLDGDLALDVVFADNAGRMHAWRADGSRLPGWEDVRFAQDIDAQNAGATQSTPVAGDVDGDGMIDVVVGAEDGKVYGWRADGARVSGFPIQTGAEVRGSAAIGDVDGDGTLELVVAGWDKQLHVWAMTGSANSSLPWPSFRRDPRNSGFVGASGVWPVRLEGRSRTIRVLPPYPNPVASLNSATALEFELDMPAQVRVSVYDARGRHVAALLDQACSAGSHCVHWDGRGSHGGPVASGVYWLEVRAADVRRTARVVVLR